MLKVIEITIVGKYYVTKGRSLETYFCSCYLILTQLTLLPSKGRFLSFNIFLSCITAYAKCRLIHANNCKMIVNNNTSQILFLRSMTVKCTHSQCPVATAMLP